MAPRLSKRVRITGPDSENDEGPSRPGSSSTLKTRTIGHNARKAERARKDADHTEMMSGSFSLRSPISSAHIGYQASV